MPEPTGQHTHILHQEPGYEKGNGGDGLPVRLVPCSTDDAIEVADDCVDALIDEGWANNQIAFLTTKNRHSIHKEFENNPVGYWKAFHDDDGEFYGHVLGFKGLVRSVVILCVNGFKDMSRAAELLYVGLSRARCLLVVVGDPDLITEAGGQETAHTLNRMQEWFPTDQPAAASTPFSVH